MKRKIVKIDESKCDGCGICLPNCAEGAIKVIGGKARLVKEQLCDGLGACLGHCPQGAISTEEREAEAYDERKVMELVVEQGTGAVKEHLAHLSEHDQHEYFRAAVDFLRERKIPVPEGHKMSSAQNPSCGCPGAKVQSFAVKEHGEPATKSGRSELGHWPVQLRLVPPDAPFLRDAELLIAADCVPCAYPDFHAQLLSGKALLVGCPKFDDLEYYKEKLVQILGQNQIRSVTYAHMEVPCCLGLLPVIKEAIAASGKTVPFKEVTISITGTRQKGTP